MPTVTFSIHSFKDNICSDARDIIMDVVERINDHEGDMDYDILQEFIDESVDCYASTHYNADLCDTIADYGWNKAFIEYTELYGPLGPALPCPLEALIWSFVMRTILLQNDVEDFVALRNVDPDDIVFRSV